MSSDYIQISKINDFIFCPKSIYLHEIYGNFNQSVYHSKNQVRGKIAHESIEKKRYSTAKRYVQSMEVYSEKYNIVGKIDIYDMEEKALIERKYKVKKIYDGYRYQLYAQYVCMMEMGFVVKKMFIHSLSDNKRYPIPLPGEEGMEELGELLSQMRSFRISKGFNQNPKKCAMCIYRELC